MWPGGEDGTSDEVIRSLSSGPQDKGEGVRGEKNDCLLGPPAPGVGFSWSTVNTIKMGFISGWAGG